MAGALRAAILILLGRLSRLKALLIATLLVAGLLIPVLLLVRGLLIRRLLITTLLIATLLIAALLITLLITGVLTWSLPGGGGVGLGCGRVLGARFDQGLVYVLVFRRRLDRPLQNSF
jgi:hypothetical protein